MTDELKARLIGLGLNDEQIGKLTDEGVKNEAGMTLLSAEEIKAATGCGLVTAKQVASAFKPVAEASPTGGFGTVSLEVLPAIPTDDNWLAALKIGGVLKFSSETVIGTVSAALANRVGLYDLPAKLIAAMEEQAKSLDEPVSLDFFELQRILTEHNYAEIFAAIPGATGRYASAPRRKELLAKIESLWEALISFHGQLTGWLDSWQKTASNPMIMMQAMTAAVSGGAGFPSGMMAPPPTDSLHDAADGVISSINRIFSGTGVIVAMALAYDAQQIRQALENPSLPAQVGAANRDQMLKKLGVGVSADYPRLEVSLKRYVLSIIELSNQTGGPTELAYINALYQLGVTIPWSTLGGGSMGLSGIGGRDQL